MSPGTAKTSLPWSRASLAVMSELFSPASTTSVPRDNPEMIRLRSGKMARQGGRIRRIFTYKRPVVRRRRP